MAYCPKCGVEVENKKCPLCSYVIKQDIHRVPFSHAVELDKKIVHFSSKEKKSIYNASTIFFAILISSICLTADNFFDKTITWAIYPIIVVTTIALITGVSLYVKGVLKILGILLLFLLMLFLLDIYIPVTNFFMMISLPISSITTIISFLVVYIIKKSKRKGANIPGYILLGITVLTLSIDMIIQNFIGGEFRITWSLITTVTLIPISLFLLYIHYIFSQRVDLNKVFHT